MAFYFDDDIRNSKRPMEIFGQFGIGVRGPAQDFSTISLNWKESQDKPDVFEIRLHDSNDGVLGESEAVFFRMHQGMPTQQKGYSPQGFLEWYLNEVCLKSGKSPVKPYETSFIYLADPWDSVKDDVEGKILKAEEIVQYPVVFLPYTSVPSGRGPLYPLLLK